MTWNIAVMLVFAGTAEPTIQYWQHQVFKSKEDCHEYIYQSKVLLVDSILEDFRNVDGKKLNGFEFFCQGKTIALDEV